jgi:hypothetical protein
MSFAEKGSTPSCLNVVADAAKFEDAMTEQAALEKTFVATPAVVQKQYRPNVQMPVEKRFVPFNQVTIASVEGTNKGTFSFNGLPALIGYDQSALVAPSQSQTWLQQTQMHEMTIMNRRACQPMASTTFGHSPLEARLVTYQVNADMNVARQLSSFPLWMIPSLNVKSSGHSPRLKDLKEGHHNLDC